VPPNPVVDPPIVPAVGPDVGPPATGGVSCNPLLEMRANPDPPAALGADCETDDGLVAGAGLLDASPEPPAALGWSPVDAAD
jgi:hypothetical protein